MNHAERGNEAQSPRTVIAARRFAALRAKGAGAPSFGPLCACLLALCASLVTFALAAAPASAAITHEFLSEITEVPLSSGAPSTGPIVEPQAMAVDSGALYVADGGQNSGRIDKFDTTTGEWLAQFEAAPSLSFLRQGIAVGHSTGETETYVGADKAGTHEGVIAVFGPAGNLQGTWSGADTPAGEFGCFECSGKGDVAVDESSNPLTEGLVYVAVPEQGAVDIFEGKTGGGEEYLAQITEREAGVPLEGVIGVAVDQQSGNVLVLDANGVDVFAATAPGVYALADRIAATPAGPFHNLSGIAVDAGNGDLYVADSNPRAIDQFGASGSYLGHLTATPAGPLGEVPASLAVDPSSHHVYVGDRNDQQGGESIDVFGASLVIPDVETAAPSAIAVNAEGQIEATLNGTVNPDSAGEATCAFVWGTTDEFGETAKCEPEAVPDGSSPVLVHAALTGLQPDTTYFYRLQASNENGANPGEAGEDQEFSTPGPGLHSTSASAVSADSATLEASIDPNNASTAYYFQYGTSTAYGAFVPAPPGPSIGSGVGDVGVSQRLQGLLPHTVYHYRVVLHSQLVSGEFEEAGTDRTFTTQAAGASLALPDNRGWELVSPPDKHGASISPGGSSLVQAAAGGDALTYLASAPTEANPPSYAVAVRVLSTRDPTGWSSRDIPARYGTSTGVIGGEEYRAFSSDLSRALLRPFAFREGSFLPLSPDTSEPTPYLRTNFPPGNVAEPCASSCYRPLVSGCPEAGESCPPSIAEHADVPPGTVFGGAESPDSSEESPKVRGASADLAHVVLDSSVGLTETPGDEGGLYEYSADVPPAEALQLISVLPGGEPAKPENNPQLGRENGAATRAISADGSRVVFSEGPAPSTNHHLYLRDLARGETVQLDAVQAGPGAGQAPRPLFLLAAADGSRIFFSDSQQLAADSGQGRDLYECQIVESGGKDKCELTDLSPETAAEPALAQGVLGASEDGSSLYFVANGVLAHNQVDNGNGAEAAHAGDCRAFNGEGFGTCNLYLRRAGATSFIARLSGKDVPDWEQELRGHTSRVSPDGRWLAFMSERPLTGYDNRDVVSGERDAEVFLYDANAHGGEGKLLCASCNPTGARPLGVEEARIKFPGLAESSEAWFSNQWLAANIPGWTPLGVDVSLYQPRYLSDSGRLFFNSSDALVPADTNATEDVYQYEPPGGETGAPPSDDCTTASPAYSPVSQGCVSLISSGTSKEESAFLDASETGDDVFFLTSARLSAQDTDTSRDVYDARSGGGFPVALKPVECSGDACQQPANPSGFESPGTSILDGPENVLQCPKGKVKKKGKCVSKKTKPKKKQSGKHHSKKGKKSKKGRATGHNRGGQK